jgi:uncharacterized protein YeaO (DUF488 family)
VIKIKRVYEQASKDDGFRILVDRLWPRGMTKAKAHVDLWFKEISPSQALRKWYGHEPEKWPEFQKRYKAELATLPEEMTKLKKLLKEHPKVTLVYGAKDEERNQAVALLGVLKRKS